jgi:colicin import membrane protein
MTAAAITDRRRLHWHAPEKGTAPAFALSLLAHALLFFAIAFMVRWKTEPAATISAELWSGFPAAAPPKVEPTPLPPPRVEPRPAPEPERKADIVVEQKKKPEPPKKVEPPKEPPKKIEPPKPDPKKVEALKREAAKAEAAKAEAAKAAAAKADAAQARAAEKRRDQELARIAAAAGTAAGTAGMGTGNAAAGGLSNSFKGQVVGCIRPHIVFNVPDGVQPKQHVAVFEVRLLPTGEQATAPKLLKSSGLPSYDQAVERAIRRCDPFPRPKEGTMPRDPVELTFDPVDTR